MEIQELQEKMAIMELTVKITTLYLLACMILLVLILGTLPNVSIWTMRLMGFTIGSELPPMAQPLQLVKPQHLQLLTLTDGSQ